MHNVHMRPRNEKVELERAANGGKVKVLENDSHKESKGKGLGSELRAKGS